jgi:hypothetical protein
MGYVPSDARWFLADLVVEFRIEGEPRNVVHINTVLVRAESAKDAYTKAMELGANEERIYENSDCQTVAVFFRGLRELSVIHDPLEHGAELIYSEEIGLSEAEVLNLVSPGESLSIFREIKPSNGPNYMPKEIWDGLVNRLGEDAMNDFMRRGDRP